MRRLNAQEWADGLSFTAWGTRLGIRVTHPEVLPTLMEVLPPAWRPSTTTRVQGLYSWISAPSRHRRGVLLHTVYSGPHHLSQGSDLPRLRDAVARDVQAHLALFSPWRVFVHAGAVGWRGKAILLPGPSGAGKSTLTAALVRAGATLLSDEFAILDRRGRAHPYPLPLRFPVDGSPRSRQVTVEAIGGVGAAGHLPVGLVAALRYEPAARPRLRRRSPGEGAMALLAQAAQARTHPERVLRSVGAAVEGAVALAGTRGEAEETARILLELVEGRGQVRARQAQDRGEARARFRDP